MIPPSSGGPRNSIIDLTDDDDDAGSRKKPRLESIHDIGEPQPVTQHHNLNPSSPTQLSSATSATFTPLAQPSQSFHIAPTALTPSASMPDDVRTDTENDRMKHAEWVDEIMEEGDAEGNRICRLCASAPSTLTIHSLLIIFCLSSVRHELQLVSTPPVPWIGASLDQLVSHCQSEHPAAWKQVLEAEDEDEGEEDETSQNGVSASTA